MYQSFRKNHRSLLFCVLSIMRNTMKLNILLFLFLLCCLACRHEAPLPTSDMGNAVKVVKKSKKPSYRVGEQIDALNGVAVYYNGNVRHTNGRHKNPDGYNYGLRWQCVEFVKRYYYDYLHHSMPNTWGHAREFFNLYLTNGAFNADRGLFQYRNGSHRKPLVDDILVFGGDKFGHIAIISAVKDDHIEVTQQNVGPYSRELIKLTNRDGRYYIRHSKVLGWLSRFGKGR